MITNGTGELQLKMAIAAKLNTDGPFLQLCPSRAWEGQAPTTTEYPYVVVGETFSRETNLLTARDRMVTIAIHLYGNKETAIDIAKLADRIVAIFDFQVLSPVDNVFVYHMRWTESTNTMGELPLRHTIIRFECQVRYAGVPASVVRPGRNA